MKCKTAWGLWAASDADVRVQAISEGWEPIGICTSNSQIIVLFRRKHVHNKACKK